MYEWWDHGDRDSFQIHFFSNFVCFPSLQDVTVLPCPLVFRKSFWFWIWELLLLFSYTLALGYYVSFKLSETSQHSDGTLVHLICFQERKSTVMEFLAQKSEAFPPVIPSPICCRYYLSFSFIIIFKSCVQSLALSKAQECYSGIAEPLFSKWCETSGTVVSLLCKSKNIIMSQFKMPRRYKYNFLLVF